jgi:hypothetical protein
MFCIEVMAIMGGKGGVDVVEWGGDIGTSCSIVLLPSGVEGR